MVKHSSDGVIRFAVYGEQAQHEKAILVYGFSGDQECIMQSISWSVKRKDNNQRKWVVYEVFERAF